MQKESQMDDLEFDNLPNRLTLVRILLIPVVVICLMVNHLDWVSESTQLTLGWVAAWIFVAASLTDFLDGYIARKRNIVTVFGSFLDPIADKFLVVSGLIMLQALGRIPPVIVIMLVLRELYMTSLRLLANTEKLTVPVNIWGKWKTGFQMTGIPMLMANQDLWFIPLAPIGTICIYIAFALSLISAFGYSMGLLKKMKIKRRLKKRRRANPDRTTNESPPSS